MTKELEYVNSYIDLEKIRYGERLDVSINVFNSISNFNISPLLLLPLVENCFKHGLKSTLEKCCLRIDISAQSDWLTIKIENSVGTDLVPCETAKNGIGLENVKRRLEIIYPNSHEFRSTNEGITFFCVLKIKNLPDAVVKQKKKKQIF